MENICQHLTYEIDLTTSNIFEHVCIFKLNCKAENAIKMDRKNAFQSFVKTELL